MFNIESNDYRVVVAVACRFRTVCVKFVDTHADYDRIDAVTVEMP